MTVTPSNCQKLTPLDIFEWSVKFKIKTEFTENLDERGNGNREERTLFGSGRKWTWILLLSEVRLVRFAKELGVHDLTEWEFVFRVVRPK